MDSKSILLLFTITSSKPHAITRVHTKTQRKGGIKIPPRKDCSVIALCAESRITCFSKQRLTVLQDPDNPKPWSVTLNEYYHKALTHLMRSVETILGGEKTIMILSQHWHQNFIWEKSLNLLLPALICNLRVQKCIKAESFSRSHSSKTNASLGKEDS